MANITPIKWRFGDHRTPLDAEHFNELLEKINEVAIAISDTPFISSANVVYFRTNTNITRTALLFNIDDNTTLNLSMKIKETSPFKVGIQLHNRQNAINGLGLSHDQSSPSTYQEFAAVIPGSLKDSGWQAPGVTYNFTVDDIQSAFRGNQLSFIMMVQTTSEPYANYSADEVASSIEFISKTSIVPSSNE